MTEQELLLHEKDRHYKQEFEYNKPDDADLAYYQAFDHVIKECGDGAISDRYLSGLRDALAIIGYF